MFNSPMKTRFSFLLILAVILTLPVPVLAQGETVDGAVYQVQPGDTLWGIALAFGVSLDELARVNGISNQDQLVLGADLIIPGLSGVNGRLTTQVMPLGEDLLSLSRAYQIAPAALAQLNRLVSPQELYAGANLILLEQQALASAHERTGIAPGQSLLELAVSSDTNPWTVAVENYLDYRWSAAAGEILRLPAGTEAAQAGPGALPAGIRLLELVELPLQQGDTAVIRLSGSSIQAVSGSFLDHELHFYGTNTELAALQGVHAMTEPGFYPLQLTGSLADGREFAFQQMVAIRDAGFFYSPPLTVDPKTTDPAVTAPENEQVLAVISQSTADKLWQGIFSSPVWDATCITSRFGERRSYNGSPYQFFHSGTDFCGNIGNDIYAPAAGRVVFTAELVVRGNFTIIDHGWGIYTAYMHQSELLVQQGDLVAPGQLIGKVGNTGRVEGPHLHWEVWVNGVQVDALYWLENRYP